MCKVVYFGVQASKGGLKKRVFTVYFGLLRYIIQQIFSKYE